MYEPAYDSYIYVVACIQSNWNASDGQSVKRSFVFCSRAVVL